MFKKIGPILVLIILLITVSISGCVSDPVTDFSGPSYVPSDYTNTRNNTTDNTKIMVYQGPAQLNLFMVAAVKDPNQEYINNISNQFGSNKSEYIQKSNESLDVNGHQIEMKIETISLFGTSISTFQSVWYCDKVRLTYATMGIVPTRDLEEMKNMTKSIQCHQWYSF